MLWERGLGVRVLSQMNMYEQMLTVCCLVPLLGNTSILCDYMVVEDSVCPVAWTRPHA